MKYLKTNLKHVKLIITICSLAFMSLTSCSGDDGPGKAACASTTENCQKYKSTGQDYISALDSVKDCVPNQSLADFEGALDEAKTEINNISC